MSSLYLHIPFCEHKCIYCDFYSIAPNGDRHDYNMHIARFRQALEQEITLRAKQEQFNEHYTTIFFGGGTPSLLEAGSIEDILGSLSKAFSINHDAEITLETNPGTVNLHKLRTLRATGINRLSVGIQSFHQDDLQFLSRIHTVSEAQACVRDAQEVGFSNISIDLIFSLPGQTQQRWESNLEQAVALNPTHISAYSLIVEPQTPLSRMVKAGQVTLVSPDDDAELYAMTIDRLRHYGYEQYEVSNFAKPGYKSRHNGNYWNHANYLGFGPSAHSFWNGHRWWNISNITGYVERLEHHRDAVAGEETLTVEQLLEEEIFLGLRSEGIDVAGFHKRFNVDLMTTHRSVVDSLLTKHLATFEGKRLRLTQRGYPLCDEICQSLL
jgi:oxygen-independent coproporphyrinogen III oxidase